jgi:hypothetical protein
MLPSLSRVHARQATLWQWLAALGSVLFWFIGPAICVAIYPMMPRDPVEPHKISIGAGAILGMITLAWLAVSATISAWLLWSSWPSTGRWFKLTLLTPYILAGLFWLTLVADGM